MNPTGTGRSLGQRAVVGVRWSAADQVFQQVIRLVLLLVLTRLLEPSAFGLLAMALVVVQLASFVTDLGTGAALIQRPAITPAHVTAATTLTVCVGLLLGGAVAAASPLIAAFFAEPQLTSVVAVMALNFPLLGLSYLPRDMLRRALLFRPLALNGVTAAAIGGAAGLALALSGAGVWALVAYSVIESFALAVMNWTAAASAGLVPRWPRLGADRRAMRDLVSFGGWVTAFKLLYCAQMNADSAVVGKVLGATALGFYSLAYRVMLYPLQKLADVLNAVALAAFARLQDDAAALRTAYQRALSAISLVCFPFSAGTAVTAPVLVPVVLGDTWVPAVLTLQVLCLNGPRMAVSRLSGSVFQAVGRPRLDAGCALLMLVVSVPALLVGARHGTVGVALGFTVAGYLVFPVQLHYTARCLGVPVAQILLALWPVLLATAALSAAAALSLMATTSWNDASRLLASVVAGASTYVLAIRLMAPADLRQLRQAMLSRGGPVPSGVGTG